MTTIDVCPSDGCLLALAGYEGQIIIFDHRESKIMKTIKVYSGLRKGRKLKNILDIGTIFWNQPRRLLREMESEWRNACKCII